MKFLTCDSDLVHQAALRNRKHRHTLLIPAPSNSIVHVYACSGSSAIRARSSRCACRNRNCASVRSEFETTQFEFIQCTFTLKEYDLTKCFAAGLKSDTDFPHAYVADVPSVHEDPAFSKGSADSDGTLANCWKDGVTVAIAKEIRALAGILEPCNRVAITARMC